VVCGIAQKREPVAHVTVKSLSILHLEIVRRVEEVSNKDEKYVCHMPETSGRCREGMECDFCNHWEHL